MEHPLFNNLLRRDKFNSLSTGEKIEFLLRKDIFVHGNVWTRGEFYCLDINSLNFNKLNSRDFDINESYKIDGVSISKNPLFDEEIIRAICRIIELNPLTSLKQEEILFRLSCLNKKDEKISFLRSQIESFKAFSLKTIMVKFYHNRTELDIYHDSKINILESTSMFQLDWIFGDQYIGDSFFMFRDDFIDIFFQEYQELCLTNYCFRQLQLLQNETDGSIIEEPDEKKTFTTYQLAFLMNEVGVIKAMQKEGLSNLEIAKIIGRIISRSPQNIRTYLREINPTSDNNLSVAKKSAQNEISYLLKYFKPLE